MAADWAGIINTTITNHIKGVQGSIVRKRKLLKRLDQEGRITYGHAGKNFDWRTPFSRNEMVPVGDMPSITYARKNRYKTPTLDWRGYYMSESLSKLDKLKNRGAQAIIKWVGDTASAMLEDIRDNFASELYVDGNASGNELRIHGLESMFARGATLGNGSNGYDAGVYNNDDTYAGLDTDQAAYGGAWVGNWPNGDGDAEYDFWTPLLVQYSNVTFDPAGGAGATWANNCVSALRYAISHGNRNQALSGETSLFLMNSDMYRKFINKLDSKERFIDEEGKAKVGFRRTVELDGVEIAQDFGVPTDIAYGLNTESLELLSMQDQLFVPQGPILHEDSQSDRFGIDFYGNLKIRQPRDFVKLATFA